MFYAGMRGGGDGDDMVVVKEKGFEGRQWEKRQRAKSLKEEFFL